MYFTVRGNLRVIKIVWYCHPDTATLIAISCIMTLDIVLNLWRLEFISKFYSNLMLIAVSRSKMFVFFKERDIIL